MIILEGVRQDVEALTFSPDGRLLLVGGSAARVQVWTAEGRRLKGILGPTGPHRAVAFLPDGLILSATGHGEIRVGPADGPTATVRHHPRAVWHHAALAAGGKAVLLCGGCSRPYMECRTVPGLELVWEHRPERYTARLCACPDGRFVVGDNDSIRLIDGATGKDVGPSASHQVGTPALAVSPDGSLLAVAANYQLEVIRLADWSSVGVARGMGRKHFTDVAFHPSGRFLMASSNNETVRIFDTSLSEVASFDWEVGRVRRVAFSPDGMRAAAAGQSGDVVVWDFDL
jgi:WD40 repeat protein